MYCVLPVLFAPPVPVSASRLPSSSYMNAMPSFSASLALGPHSWVKKLIKLCMKPGSLSSPSLGGYSGSVLNTRCPSALCA